MYISGGSNSLLLGTVVFISMMCMCYICSVVSAVVYIGWKQQFYWEPTCLSVILYHYKWITFGYQLRFIYGRTNLFMCVFCSYMVGIVRVSATFYWEPTCLSVILFIVSEYSGISYVLLGTNLFKGYSVHCKWIFGYQLRFTREPTCLSVILFIISEYSGISYVLLGTNLFKCYSVHYQGIFGYQLRFTGNQPV